ncbi:MAG: aldo/keto reductase [Gammaproteobacteria bacterium]
MNSKNKQTLSRRRVLGIGAAAMLPGSLLAASPALRTRVIPSTGEDLAVIGLGTSRTFDVELEAPEMSALREVVKVFVQAGGQAIDSSPMYGKAEAVTGRLLDDLGYSDRVFMATKIWTKGKQDESLASTQQRGIEQMEESEELLGRQQLDLMQVHNLISWQEHLPVLREWKESGRIRYMGITHSRDKAFDEVEKVLLAEQWDFLQINYSLAERGAADRLLPLCAERGVAVMVNRAFQKGVLFKAVEGRPLPPWAAEFGAQTWGQFFLKYVLAHPAVTCVIPATRKVSHMEDNLEAGRGELPDAAHLEKMRTYLDTL